MRKYIISALALFAAAGIVLCPGELSASVRSSVSGCLEIVIPALFAFTVLAVYMQKSGLYRTALRPVTKPLSLLLGIPEELCAVFLLANIGGYPVGARLLTVMVKNGRLSRGSAAKLLCCCYGSGPSFVIGTAGTVVFGSAAVGGIIYAACFLSSLVMAVVICRTGERITLAETSCGCDLSAECFVQSVDSGARVMYTVCAMAAAFAAVTALLECSGATRLVGELLRLAGLGGNAERVFPAFLEVTRIRDMLPGKFAAPLCAGLLSFGGVCVLTQVAAITGGAVPMKRLVATRIPAALLSAVFALPAGFIDTAREAGTFPPAAEAFSVNAGLSVCVLIMAGMLTAGCAFRRR